MVAGGTRIPRPTAFLGVDSSPCLLKALLPAALPAGSCFSVSASPLCLGTQNPTHTLCAQLRCAETSRQEITAQGHLCECRGCSDLTRAGCSVPSSEQRNKIPSPSAHPVHQEEKCQTESSSLSDKCCLEVLLQMEHLPMSWR